MLHNNLAFETTYGVVVVIFKELTGILVLRLLRALTVGVSILRTCDNSSFLRLHGGGADPGVQFIHQGK